MSTTPLIVNSFSREIWVMPNGQRFVVGGSFYIIPKTEPVEIIYLKEDTTEEQLNTLRQDPYNEELIAKLTVEPTI